MKNYLIFFMLVSFTNIFAQKFNVANYSCLIHLSDASKQVDAQFNLLSKAEEVAEDVNFRLEFNDKTAAFFVDNDLDIDAMSLHMLKALTKTSGSLFTNLQESCFVKEIIPTGNLVYILGKENILIKESIFKKWEITSESKIINGYKCFRANFTKTQTMLGKEYTDKAIAWFCPEIPVSLGPAEFSGLPGLIFQLQANEYSFVLKNVTFESNLKISTPSSGKEMTLDEYLKLSSENMEKLKEMAKTYKE
uniref:GLPGLI family protein n=1 Tax=Flavobacterium sp. TaxID=239 RepID=UPI00404A196E